MSTPPALRLTTRAFIAVLLVLLFVLFLRSWLQIELQQRGMDRKYAGDLSYLAVFPLVVLMYWAVLREQLHFIAKLFDPGDLSWRLVLTAVVIGILMRVAWWSQLVARVSFGITRSDDPAAIVGPAFLLDCPPPLVIGLGFLVMAVLVPVTEEIVHRGVVQSALVHRGRVVAIASSALIFAVFHPPSSYVFVFLFGIVFGLQFWNAGTLWSTLITHATYNALVQLDWRCLQTQWNPPGPSLPLWTEGTAATASLVVCATFVLWLVTRPAGGARIEPRQ